MTKLHWVMRGTGRTQAAALVTSSGCGRVWWWISFWDSSSLQGGVLSHPHETTNDEHVATEHESNHVSPSLFLK